MTWQTVWQIKWKPLWDTKKKQTNTFNSVELYSHRSFMYHRECQKNCKVTIYIPKWKCDSKQMWFRDEIVSRISMCHAICARINFSYEAFTQALDDSCLPFHLFMHDILLLLPCNGGSWLKTNEICHETKRKKKNEWVWRENLKLPHVMCEVPSLWFRAMCGNCATERAGCWAVIFFVGYTIIPELFHSFVSTPGQKCKQFLFCFG